MASKKQAETVVKQFDFSQTDSPIEEEGKEGEVAGASQLRSPQDQERRKKIFENWRQKASKTGKRSLSLSTATDIDMYSSSFQNTLDHFSNDEAFDYKGFTDQSTLFNFPQKPIEQEALRLEEVEIEQRANRKRKETADTQSTVADDSKVPCTDDVNLDLSRKFLPCFQRVNVGEDGASGVSSTGNFLSMNYCYCIHFFKERCYIVCIFMYIYIYIY